MLVTNLERLKEREAEVSSRRCVPLFVLSKLEGVI